MTEQQTETDNRQEDGGKRGQNTKKKPRRFEHCYKISNESNYVKTLEQFVQ